MALLRRRYLGWVAAGVALLAVGLAACGGGPATGKPQAAASQLKPPAALGGVALKVPLPASISGLPLTTAAGRRTTLAAYRGKIVMIADFLTLCQDMCPMISANVAAIARQIQAAGLAGQVALLEITVDPQRDTPARLTAYQKLFGGKLPGWMLLRAAPADTAALWKFFHVYYQREPEEKPPGIDWLTGKRLSYDVEHGNNLIFLSPDGTERYVLDAAADARGALPPGTLVRFLDGQGLTNLYHPAPADSWTVPQAMQVVSWLAGRKIPAAGSS
jgi:protein SCO1